MVVCECRVQAEIAKHDVASICCTCRNQAANRSLPSPHLNGVLPQVRAAMRRDLESVRQSQELHVSRGEGVQVASLAGKAEHCAWGKCR